MISAQKTDQRQFTVCRQNEHSFSGWQKLCEGMKGLRRKVWTQTKILSSNICYSIAILRCVAIYALFKASFRPD